MLQAALTASSSGISVASGVRVGRTARADGYSRLSPAVGVRLLVCLACAGCLLTGCIAKEALTRSRSGL